MADTLTRRSPLQEFTSRFAGLHESVRIDEEPFIEMVDLWVDPAGRGGKAAADVLNVRTLPATASTAVTTSDTTIIWLGPQEWLITRSSPVGRPLETRLRAVISDHGGAAVDVSAQRTTVRLRGAHARDVLSKGCSLDLHPAVFGRGSAAQTMLGQAAVILIPLDDNGTDYRILVRSSFAGYLAEWLIDAAEEFGVDW